MSATRILDRWAVRTEQSGGTLVRWALGSCRGWSCYLHQVIGDDDRGMLHDHSRRFISIGLWGGYREYSIGATRDWRAPWVRTFPATHAHRIERLTRVVWTLVLAGPRERKSRLWVERSS